MRKRVQRESVPLRWKSHFCIWLKMFPTGFRVSVVHISNFQNNTLLLFRTYTETSKWPTMRSAKRAPVLTEWRIPKCITLTGKIISRSHDWECSAKAERDLTHFTATTTMGSTRKCWSVPANNPRPDQTRSIQTAEDADSILLLRKMKYEPSHTETRYTRTSTCSRIK